MKPAENVYVVRIIRHGEKDPSRLVGVVEDASGDEKRAFHSAKELLCILIGQDRTEA